MAPKDAAGTSAGAVVLVEAVEREGQRGREVGLD
jgi:hypothetical protein